MPTLDKVFHQVANELCLLPIIPLPSLTWHPKAPALDLDDFHDTTPPTLDQERTKPVYVKVDLSDEMNVPRAAILQLPKVKELAPTTMHQVHYRLETADCLLLVPNQIFKGESPVIDYLMTLEEPLKRTDGDFE
jgi:hypothetical protein